MYEKTTMLNGLPGRRALALLITGVLIALAVLGLATLAAAQTPPVSVTKTVSPTEVTTGSIIVYTVVFSNASANPVDLQPIEDTLPSGFSFLGMAAGSEIEDNPMGTTGTIVWSGPYTVSPTDTLTAIYSVYVAAPPSVTPYLNHVTAVLSTGETIEDQAAVTVTGPHLTGTKSAPAGSIPDRNPLDYTVTLVNDGSSAATIDAITDTLPGHFQFVEMVSGAVPAPVQNGQQLIWTGPIAIAAGGSLQFTYRVEADGTVGQLHTNSVLVAYDGLQAGPYIFTVLVTLNPTKAFLPLVIRNVTPPPPVIEPKLVYETKPGDNYDIYSINVDGTESFNISARSGGDLNPDWSPDGTRVAWEHYSGNADIFVGDADGTDVYNITNVTGDDKDPEWSPDGSKILFRAYRDGRWDVFHMNPDGTNQQKLTGDRPCQSTLAKWSPNGTKIGFICGIDEAAEVYVMNADGSNQVRLTDDSDEDAALNWSPDGTRLVYVRVPDDDDSEIWVVDVNTEVATRLTTNSVNDFSPMFSPDGTKIVFSHYYADFEVTVMNADGTNMINLTNSTGGDYVPQWSPDGTTIAFLSNRNGNKELYVMNADGSGQFRLTSTAADEINFDWRPIAP